MDILNYNIIRKIKVSMRKVPYCLNSGICNTFSYLSCRFLRDCKCYYLYVILLYKVLKISIIIILILSRITCPSRALLLSNNHRQQNLSSKVRIVDYGSSQITTPIIIILCFLSIPNIFPISS